MIQDYATRSIVIIVAMASSTERKKDDRGHNDMIPWEFRKLLFPTVWNNKNIEANMDELFYLMLLS